MAGLVGSLLISLSARTEELERGLAKARSEVASLKKPVLETQTALNGLGESVVRLGAGLVTLAALKRGIEGVVSSGVEMQRLNISFGVITGSSQGAQKALDTVRVTAEDLGASFTDLADAYKGIVAASKGTQLEGEKTTEIFKGLVSAGAALQLSQESIKGILLATQQIMSKGTITAEDFKNQIGERLPGAMNILARSLNVTTAELTKMMEAGELPASRMLDFARQANAELGAKAAANAHTLTNEWERLKNAVFALGVELDKLGVNRGLSKLLELATMSAKGLGLLAKDVQQIVNGPQLPAIQSLQEQFPNAQIVGTPQAAAVQETVRQLNAAQNAAEDAAKAVQAFGDTDSIARRSAVVALKQQEAEVARLSQQYETQYEALRNIGEVSQRLGEIRERTAQAIKDDPTLDPDRGQKAVDLQKELQQRYDDLQKTLGKLDERVTINPGSRLEVLKEQIQELEKVIKSVESTLSSNKTLLPLLTGQGGAALQSSLFPKANAAGLAAALPLIQSQASTYSLDPNLVAAQAYRESAFNPRAVSRAGAQGLMQLMPETAAGLGVTDPFDIQQNLTGGMKYLQKLLAKFSGDMALALAAYNAGPNRVIQAGYKIPAIPETQAYVKDILGRTAALSAAGGIPATGAGTGVTTQLAQLQDLLRQKQLQVLDIGNFDKGIERLGRFLSDYDQLRLSAEEFQATEVERLNKQSALRQDLQKQFTQDPLKAQLALTQQLSAAQEQVGQQFATNTLRTMGQDQARQIDDIVRSLIEENRALGLSKEAIQDYELAVRHATDADLHEVAALREKQVALLADRDAAETRATQVGDIEAMAKALGDERDGLTLTADALLQKRLALAQAGDGQRALIESLQQGNKELRAAAQATDFFLSTIEELATGSKISFAQIAQSFNKLLLSILIDASGIRQALTGTVKGGIDWLGAALGLVKTGVGAATATEAASAVEGFRTGSGSLPLATVDDAGNVLTGFEGRAMGGSVYAGVPYAVGERGPETFIPAQNGTIVPHSMSQGQFPPVIVNIYGVQDIQSFQRSRGELNRGIAQAVQQAQRAM